jgi:hypothetical protein
MVAVEKGRGGCDGGFRVHSVLREEEVTRSPDLETWGGTPSFRGKNSPGSSVPSALEKLKGT